MRDIGTQPNAVLRERSALSCFSVPMLSRALPRGATWDQPLVVDPDILGTSTI